MTGFEVTTELLGDDGTFPNNETLPVLIYRGAFDAAAYSSGDDIERTFRQNRWGATWQNGIYSYHHYHSTAHEVLGVARGTATVRLGGDSGIAIDLAPGDVVVLPAGVAHKNEGSSADFLVVGAYPLGQEYDMNYGKPEERPAADRNIEATPLPETDPVHGSAGPVLERWGKR